MKLRKLFAVLSVVSTLLLPSLSNQNHNVINNFNLTEKRALGDVSDVFSGSIGEFKDNVYDDIQGAKKIGKYYRVGWMGHHQVVEFGRGMALKTRELEKLTDFYDYDTIDSLTLKDVNYSMTKTLATTAEVKVGVAKMIDASVNLSDTRKVGTETKTTVSHRFDEIILFSESFSKTYSISADFNLNNLLSGKKNFCISRIALYIEIPIERSYTEEERWGKWKGPLKGTLDENYFAHYYIDNVITFRYEDNTFGDKKMEEYYIDNMIKNY